MRWRKLGRVFVPDGTRWWARSHAHLPTPVVLDDRTIRVYYAALDQANFGRMGFVDLDAADPTRVRYESPDPVLDLGPLGAFDDSGVTPSCAVTSGDRELMYYIGWQRTERVPYMLFTGLAARVGAGAFERVSPTPVLDRTPAEPYSRSAPYVQPPAVAGGEWTMWYWTCLRWVETGSQPHYFNVIKRAVSPDGVAWVPDAGTEVEPPDDDDYAVGRPWVIGGARPVMLFSVRGHRQPYRIAAATRDAAAGAWSHAGVPRGLELGGGEWESEMMCYPAVVDAGGSRFLFYNGNGHGRTGFGVAILDSE